MDIAFMVILSFIFGLWFGYDWGMDVEKKERVESTGKKERVVVQI